jgi:hypothetical protein
MQLVHAEAVASCSARPGARYQCGSRLCMGRGTTMTESQPSSRGATPIACRQANSLFERGVKRTKSEIIFSWKEIRQKGIVQISGADFEAQIPYEVGGGNNL